MKTVLLAGVSAVVLGFAGIAAAQESIDADIDDDNTLDLAAESDDTAAGNVALQRATNLFDMDDEANLVDGLYDATLDFNSNAFENNALSSAAWNSGINAAQQGGVGLAANSDNDHDAVAANVLSQIVSNTVQDVDELVDDSNDEYLGTMTFSGDAFQGSTLTAYGFNTGINAAQQGAVATAVSGNTSTVP